MTKRKTWRCFHCDDVFYSVREASRHFGANEDAKPACQIVANAELGLLGALREVEKELSELWCSVHNEGTEAARSIHAQAGRHYVQLREAEEAGYARGLRDAKAEMPPPIPSFMP
jgi:hypothetical protein